MADTSAPASLLTEYTRDWKRLRRQKARKQGGIEARTLLALGWVFGEHYLEYASETLKGHTLTDEDKNKLFLTFNLIGRSVWRKLGRLYAIDAQFRATPNTTDPAAFDRADVVVDLIRGLNQKIGEKQHHWNRLFWTLVGGVAIEHTPWEERTTLEPIPITDPATGAVLFRDHLTKQVVSEAFVDQQVRAGVMPERFAVAEQLQLVGEVGAELFTPLDFFVDASVRELKRLGPGQGCYLAQIKTKDWITQTFGSMAANLKRSDDLNIMSTRLSDDGRSSTYTTLSDLVPALQGSHAEDDPDMAIVITRYTPPSDRYPSGSRCIFVPDQLVLDEIDLKSLGYDDGIPCVDFHFRPPATTFWTPGFVDDQISGNKFLNKRMSQLGEAANAQVYEVLLLGGGLTKADIPTDYPGSVQNGLDEGGNPKVRPMERGTLPPFFVESIKLVGEFLDVVGSADLLSRKQFPGQLRGPMAIPMLQELLDSEDGPVYQVLGEQLAAVHGKRVARVKNFYPPIRTLHYTGEDNRDEVLEFHRDEVLNAGWSYQITVDPGSLIPELSALREARVRERLESPLSVIYINRRTGRIDPSKIAHDLKYSDRQRDSRESQYRKLARQIIGRLWRGEQLDPALPLPFWDHDVMMDELEAAMATLEWIEASMPIKQQFYALYQKHQAILQQQHEMMQQAIQSQMMHSAVAQATQQTAAKTAALVTESALTQIDAQMDQQQAQPSSMQIAQEMIASQRQPLRRGGRPPVRRQPTPIAPGPTGVQ